jgi:hypothetical protein
MTKIETRHVHYIGLLLAFVIGGTASFGWTFLWPPRPVVTFAEGLPLVEPNTVRPGQDITVTYVIRRNETCTVTIYPRFLNRDTESIDGNVTRAARETPSIETNGRFNLLSLTIAVPENIYAGAWAYAPLVEPGPNCRSSTAVEPTPAPFYVSESVACDRVRVSGNGRYHEPGSPWYDRVTSPIACYSSPEDAEADDYVRAGQ